MPPINEYSGYAIVIAVIGYLIKMIFDILRTKNGGASPTQISMKQDFAEIVKILEVAKTEAQSHHAELITVQAVQTEILRDMKISNALNGQELHELRSINDKMATNLESLNIKISLALGKTEK